MNKYTLLNMLVVISLFGPASTIEAGTFYKTPHPGRIVSIDKKTRTIVLVNDSYKLRHGVRIHDVEHRLPSISTLKPGMDIKYQTHKNKRTGQVEMSEIWVIYY